MKKLLYLSLILACLLCACGQGAAVEKIEITQSDNPWGVTVEQIDLDNPENKQYIDWAKKDRADRGPHPVYELPGPGDWTYGDDHTIPHKKCLPWNEKMEFVIRWQYLSDCDCYNELLVRRKATGKTIKIAEAYVYSYDGSYFEVTEILSDTQFLYSRGKGDVLNYQSFLYDLKTGESICVASDNPQFFRDLGGERYLWLDWDRENGYPLYLIDARAFKAGEKDAKRMLVRRDNEYYVSEIQHLSSDKRFVYMGLYRPYDTYYTMHREVYDVITGEQVAFCEVPDAGLDWTLINDDLEYGYCWGGDWSDPTILSFFVIHYDYIPPNSPHASG